MTDRTPRFIYDDGGRAAAGFRGKRIGDCVCRAIAIATGKPYAEVHAELTAIGWTERLHRQRYFRDANGSFILASDIEALCREHEYIENLGWEWTPPIKIGSKVHLRADELPAGRLIVQVSHHLVAVIDGVIHDIYNCSSNGTRRVYSYWTRL